MNECSKNNILNIEIYTDNGLPSRYTITVYNACGENVAGAVVCGAGKEFMLPDGEYKIEVKGDAYASPRMQQRWITICGTASDCRFGMNFIFGRVNTYSGEQSHPGKPLPCPSPCHSNRPKHPCAPSQSPFLPSMYVKEWEKQNNIEYNCSHSYTHSSKNDIMAECNKYKAVPKAPECKPEGKPAPKNNSRQRSNSCNRNTHK
ncbi:MAG: hypothetical protein LBL80_01250 [Ruminococcus sp.]|jgi:hypothetical protein|nr:hypothetical protein [Ruminococcus sp.]